MKPTVQQYNNTTIHQYNNTTIQQYNNTYYFRDLPSEPPSSLSCLSFFTIVVCKAANSN